MILSSKVIPEGIQSELLGPLWGALKHQWGHFDVPVPLQSPFKTLSKDNQKIGNFRPPQRTATEYRSMDIFGKSSDFAAEG